VRILFLGASGFLGRELAADLARRGHEIVPAVRNPPRVAAMTWQPAVVIDLNRDTSPESWIPRLADIDAVVNCAGVLHGSRKQSIASIHRDAPVALFKACERAGVRRVVQISAISANPEAGTAYALTKRAADDFLRASALDWVVLRPSLVHGRGARGGTALFRAMAALPLAIPIPGEGQQEFQPIHIDDLARVLALSLETDRLVHKTIDPVGPEVVTLATMLRDYRRWLGFEAAPMFSMPPAIVRIAAAIGTRLGATINDTSLAQMRHGNIGDYGTFTRETGIEASGWKNALATHPAQEQDRWHARLYFARPALRYTLAILWLASGITGLLDLRGWAVLLISQLPIRMGTALFALAVACIADMVVAVLLLRRWRPRRLALIQVILVTGYTIMATALFPSLWLEPLGPLLKNLPILAAILAWAAIEEES
jgi:uncharacterized protein YbjT (DUF2867 family)